MRGCCDEEAPTVSGLSLGDPASGLGADNGAVALDERQVRGDRWCKLYAGAPGAGGVIEEVVREWFEQNLIEAVLGVQSLEGAREWSSEDIGRAVSEESLTVAVMPRYHLDVAVNRALGSKLGTLKLGKARAG